MKKILLLSLLGISFGTTGLLKLPEFDFHHIFRRCSGSNSFCSGCSTCVYCKHCAVNGGSCAVCYIPRAVVNKNSPAASHPKKRKTTGSHLSRPSSGLVSSPKPQKRSELIDDRSGTEPADPDSFEVAKVVDPVVKEVVVDLPVKKTPDHVTNTGFREYNYAVEIPEGAQFVRVTAGRANLRSEASTSSKIRQQLQHGDLLLKLGRKKGWLKVQTLDSGEIGYVSENLLL
ncbi:SH3 domain-containing protein [Dyadobacter helix]|uniref:SH3 domain-containing protein n=1 Tax=Dyadobacter helix TaxID=2822344 RepID=UPI001BFC7E52|nr:SH3 domain-containing protein [Dyadobacter sp. CECT 9275]